MLPYYVVYEDLDTLMEDAISPIYAESTKVKAVIPFPSIS
jgi:hypothetical protein